MDHRVVGLVVVKTKDSLGAFLDVESWARSKAVITKQVRISKSREDVLLERLDGELVEVNLLTINIGRSDRSLAQSGSYYTTIQLTYMVSQ